MPTRSPRLCNQCSAVVRGPCPNCSSGWTTRPAKTWTAGSNTLWRKTRAAYLADNPLCEWCGAFADVVDHRDGTDYETQRYDWNQLRALCTPCHGKRTAQQGLQARGGASKSPHQRG